MYKKESGSKLVEKVEVLRIGHRPSRDKRLSTHIGLVARAFGAEKVYFDKKDVRVEKSIKDVVERMGGDFKIVTGVGWRSLIREWEGEVVHLTMKGTNLMKELNEIKNLNKVLTVVGSEKVPNDLYSLANRNIAITHQPHSEVAALAVFLDRIFDGSFLK